MSILIKGMRMPEECRDCPLEMYYMNCGDTRCRATNKLLADDYRAIPFSGRPDWCPLVEVPAPHGRLIDVDKLLRDAPRYVDYPPHYEPKLLSILDVENAPTVIEAEEGED